MNQEYLQNHLDLEIEVGKPIYKSDSKLILLGKSRQLGDRSVVLKFSNISLDLVEAYVNNFSMISKLKSHPSILSHYKVFKIQDPEIEYNLVEILEFVQEVQPSEVFKSGLSPNKMKAMIIRLLEGFSFLHANHLLHRDIKPDNFLIYFENGSHYFKIIDLDFLGGEANELLVTTPEFLAPEVNSYSDYNVKAEIWAIGLVLYLIFGGKMPIKTRKQKLTVEEVKNEVLNCQFDFSVLPRPLRIPLSLCLKKNPKDRIGSIDQLIFIIDPIYYLRNRLTSFLR